MSTFSSGDRVRVVAPGNAWHGEAATVIEHDRVFPQLVHLRMDNPDIRPHDRNRSCLSRTFLRRIDQNGDVVA